MTPHPTNARHGIAERLTRMNEATSSQISASKEEHTSPLNVSRMFLVRSAIGAFANSFFARNNAGHGKARFISSCGAALEALLGRAKVWEYELRQGEGKGNLPPSNDAEVKKMSAKYSPLTIA